MAMLVITRGYMVPQPMISSISQPWNLSPTTERSPLGAALTRSTPGFLCGELELAGLRDASVNTTGIFWGAIWWPHTAMYMETYTWIDMNRPESNWIDWKLCVIDSINKTKTWNIHCRDVPPSWGAKWSNAPTPNSSTLRSAAMRTAFFGMWGHWRAHKKLAFGECPNKGWWCLLIVYHLPLNIVINIFLYGTNMIIW